MRYFLLATLFFLLACEKETDDNKDISQEVQGQWIRGSFDLSEFWNYTGPQVQPPSNTDGIDIRGDGSLFQYLVFFPTDPQMGCKPQKLMFRKGKIELNDIDSTFRITYHEGRYKEFYQSCAGKVNIDEIINQDSLDRMTISGYYKILNSDGKKLFGISYVGKQGPYLYLEKKDF